MTTTASDRPTPQPEGGPAEDRRVALVTGAAYGIGAGVALALAEDGFDVVATAEVDPAETVAAVEAAGGRAWGVVADLADPGAGAVVVEAALERAGRLDALVNNAGITLDRPLASTTEDDFDRIYAVNVRAMWAAVKAAVQPLAAAGGAASIVNISSIHAVSSMVDHSVYAGTKGAIVAMTRSLALELAPRGIRVNCVLPGAVEVPRYREVAYDPNAMAVQIPIGRLGAPSDIGAAVAYLVSARAGFVTGTALVVDGGTTAQMALGLG